MGSPYQYPWVNYGSVTVADIDSTEQLLFTASKVTIIVSIIACNTTDREIFIDFNLLTERIIDDVPVDQKPYVVKNRLLSNLQSTELLPSADSIIILQPGDFVYAKSDFSNNLWDCIMSYEELLETA